MDECPTRWSSGNFGEPKDCQGWCRDTKLDDAKKLWKDLGIHLNTVVDLSLFVKCVDSGLFAERLDRYADVPLPPESAVILDPSSQSLPQTTDFPEEHYKSEAFLGPHIHRLFRGPYSAPVGLARLTEMYTGIVLTKGKITRSNWEAVLTQAQLTYAALDAYAGYIVYAHLVKLFNLLEPTQRPRRRFYAFDCIRGTLYHCCGDSMRTLPGELMDDSDHPRSDHGDSFPTVFYSVGDEIAMHLQGIGTDQPFGLVPWTESNPEYNPGPMRPRKTPEEKEAARIARQKRRTGNQAEEREGQSVGAHSNAETKGPQNGKESAPHSKVSRPPIHPPSQSNRPPPRPTKSLGPNTSRPTAPNFAKQTAFRPSATKSDMNGITTAMKIDRPPEVQSKATVAQTALSLGPSQNNTKDRQTNRRVRSKRNSPLKAT